MIGSGRVIAWVVVVVLGLTACSLADQAPTPSTRNSSSQSPSSPTTAPVDPATCSISPRGLPSCGTYVGMAYGSNSDLEPVEAQLGRKNALHRTFWTSAQIDAAVRTAKADVAARRLPWVSFKTPYSWPQMTAGWGDSWVNEIRTRLADVPGPVWVTVSHEPENDGGDIADWKAMQERIGPELRKASNIGFAVILMGYHQLFGKPEYSFERMWPATKIDVVGFDVYSWWGSYKNGTMDTKHPDLDEQYFARLSAWAEQQGVPWGLAETGYTDYADARDPNWLARTYQQVRERGGVAFCYFNTDTNSRDSTWLLNPAKLAKYDTILKTSPRIK